MPDVALNTCGNIISGQVTGETARLLSDRFGRTLQHRESLTSTYNDLHVTQSNQLEPVIPESRIASLSPGEFVGMVADAPDQPIALKSFCCRLDADFLALEAEKDALVTLPLVKEVTDEMLTENFRQIRLDVTRLAQDVMDKISSTPNLRHFLIP